MARARQNCWDAIITEWLITIKTSLPKYFAMTETASWQGFNRMPIFIVTDDNKSLWLC